MHVIFNADDFGLTPGVNLGTIAASQSGVVRSTTLMVDMAAEKQAVELVSSATSLNVGLHLRFTTGAALTASNTLTRENGQFLGQDDFWQNNTFAAQQIADEVTAQVEHFLALGLSLSHIDSHHHAHTHPQILPIVTELARYYKVPLRGGSFDGDPSRDYRYIFSNEFYGDEVSLDNILGIIDKYHHQCDVLEIMCHPAFIDQPLLEASAYSLLRAKELAILTDAGLSQRLEAKDIEVCDFSIFSK
ncbi:chitin disaccharide deacetylase [Photobacterium profundum]|uniref:Hypothetical phospho-beta-glucosidase n=1 Tax=Photobacterium profundum (strain SS9) TaxID=298386 RepID=Q6LUU7_PHOPR|nr:hypothetical phospho-beta-glucosidase [Photobacterium profundum SS9]